MKFWGAIAALFGWLADKWGTVFLAASRNKWKQRAKDAEALAAGKDRIDEAVDFGVNEYDDAVKWLSERNRRKRR